MCPSLLTLTSSALFELAEVLNHSDTFAHFAEDSIVQELVVYIEFNWQWRPANEYHENIIETINTYVQLKIHALIKLPSLVSTRVVNRVPEPKGYPD